MDKTQTATIQMPVNRLSQSSLLQLLRNPLIFKMKHILGVYDGKMGVSGMVGRAGHESLKVYYGGNKDIALPIDRNEARTLAIDYGMDYLNKFDDHYIDYGKTGSREAMLQGYAKAMNFYFSEEPEYNEILMCEEKMEAELKTVDGDILPLPAVGIPDLVNRRKDGGIDIIDTKFVKSFTDYESEDWVKIIQGQFLWHLMKESKGLIADRMVYREIKWTENSGANQGKPQIRDWVFPFSHEPYRIFFYNLYKDACKFLANPNAVYLPNLSDIFDGEHAGLMYSQGLIDSDMSDVEVMHKVKDVALVSKKFVSSRLESVENQFLNPEEKIKLRLAEFGIPIEPEAPIIGNSVVQYRFKVSAGVRMSVFEKYKADIARAIEAKGQIRILAPIPGTSLVGVEVSTETRTSVILENKHLVKNTLSLPIGVTVNGDAVKMPLNEMPHLLIAGATGSGKSILIHSLIHAITKQMKPEDLTLFLIDPKRVELRAWGGIKHLHGGNIIFEHEHAVEALRGLSEEMEKRYKTLEQSKMRDISEFNEHFGFSKVHKMPYIVMVIDEYADLIYASKQSEKKNKRKNSIKASASKAYVEAIARQFAKDGMKYEPKVDEEDERTAEEIISRLAAMARAVGIHLIIATQRPSVDVLTGLIKANFPTRIAMTVSSAIDSKVIGIEGAEKLNGKGDLLFMTPGRETQRLQGFLLNKIVK